ncbi:hypothetical protein MTBPR1_30201 [Candidatus Terasakiella magnetica]|uniref:Uncharacterized protein n=1 Tax=Candidatus Terasakiella magnetica TaxID=1867952 RepID=A0A1C3RHS8_9PROT|nr:hypothetical protein [Candidatus Terasakiella magnetica]SCA56831.1 hypothetical protein MTBPR1_30201 [Candidatus Terasakiella magnetica]
MLNIYQNKTDSKQNPGVMIGQKELAKFLKFFEEVSQVKEKEDLKLREVT